MLLNVYIGNDAYKVDVPQEILEQGEDFFARMDQDMDRGWQMGREYVERPDTLQRCQIAADKLLTAMHTENRKVALLMAAYILTRTPGVAGVQIDTAGEMTHTEMIMATPTAP
ncbi:MAG: hypothetical protein ACE5H7_05540 [Acidiferrobacterales bacterium]